jgi:chromosome segregation ATPase
MRRPPPLAQHGESARNKAPASGGGDGSALEQRLRALVESEREGQELLQKLREELLVAQREDAERRLAVLEKVLAEARIESAKREETEQALGRERAETARLADELRKAERTAEAARTEVKPRAARKIAELEKTVAERQAKAERERAKRSELERELEAVSASEQKTRVEVERERAKRAELERRIEELNARERAARQAHEQQLAELEDARAAAERTATETHQALAEQRAERDREHERLRAIEQLIHDAATESKQSGSGSASTTSPELPSPPTEAQGASTAPRPRAFRRSSERNEAR